MATLSIIDPLRGSIAFDDAAQVVAALDVLTDDTTGRFKMVRYKNKYHPDTPRPIPFRNVMVNILIDAPGPAKHGEDTISIIGEVQSFFTHMYRYIIL